jgi:glycosyltransferase involved in cell wall biosynthesis
MTKRIVVMMFIQYYFRDSYGGGERQLASIAPLLMERNVEIHVVSRFGRNSKGPLYEDIDGVHVHRMPFFLNKPLSAIVYLFFGLFQIFRVRPDILHAHGLFSPTTTAIWGSRIFRLPVVAIVFRGGVLGDIIRIKEKMLGKRRIAWLAKHLDGLLALSQEIMDELKEEGFPQEKCYYIPNGVDIDRFRPLAPDEKKQLRKELGYEHGPVVVYVGRLVPAKRVDTLIRSWERVRLNFPTAQLLLVGAGEDREKLEAMAGEGISFIGRVDKVENWLQIGDIYVLPSVAEGLSNALLEAMASALPIVVTAVGDAPILIKTNENGWCIPADDIEALTNALTEALRLQSEDPERLQHMGELSRQRILKDFQLSAIADKTRQLYDEVLE